MFFLVNLIDMTAPALLLVGLASALWGQGVTFDRLLHPDAEPQNWLSYSRTIDGQRYSPLNQITPANVKNLELQWVWQARSLEKFEARRWWWTAFCTRSRPLTTWSHWTP
jgi:hypothetical protein